MPRRSIVALALLALASCKGRSGGDRGVPTAAATATAALPAASESAFIPPAGSAALSAAPAASAAVIPTRVLQKPGQPGDVCRVLRGPIQLPFTGPVTLVAGADDEPRIVVNRDGVPHGVTLPKAIPPKGGKDDKKPERLALGEPAERLPGPGCAVAGDLFFCIDKSGLIHRSGLEGANGQVMGMARAGSPVAAALLGSHVVYAFLGDRKTSEGATTLAFVGLDDTLPVTLSEDGSGATSLALHSRGEEALAMYVDARRVLTPVHARVLTHSGKLGLGPDAVLFVGSGTEGRTPAVIGAGSGGQELVLLALDKDDKDFGMAAIRVEEQPRDDAPITWSTYPAAMERPAIAATSGVWPIRVLRARPSEADTKSKKLLEIGEVDAAGVFKASCAVAEGSRFADLSVLVDGAGALWLAYTDADGTWIERRGK